MTTAFTTEEADLLRQMAPDARLFRAAFAGEAFRIEYRGVRPGRYAEAMVLSLIERGLMRALQQTQPWPARAIPARPYTVALTTEGEKARKQVLDGRADLQEAA